MVVPPAWRKAERNTPMVNPQGVRGPWRAGIVLDWHTVGSQLVGQNEFGHPIFETQRTPLGELLFRFKYRADQAALTAIVAKTVEYLGPRTRGKFDLLIPVPPSNPTRVWACRLAEEIAAGLGVPYSDSALTKIKATGELKSVADPEIRREMLQGAFQANALEVRGKTVLIVDDLYRSGATLEAAAEAVTGVGSARAVYVLAITRTRVNK